MRLLAGVESFMHSLSEGVGKGLVAEVTTERFVACVCPLMPDGGTRLVESPSTKSTTIGLLPRVDSFMSRDLAVVLESLAAEGALVGPICRCERVRCRLVACHVLAQAWQVRATFPAGQAVEGGILLVLVSRLVQRLVSTDAACSGQLTPAEIAGKGTSTTAPLLGWCSRRLVLHVVATVIIIVTANADAVEQLAHHALWQVSHRLPAVL